MASRRGKRHSYIVLAEKRKENLSREQYLYRTGQSLGSPGG